MKRRSRLDGAVIILYEHERAESGLSGHGYPKAGARRSRRGPIPGKPESGTLVHPHRSLE